MLKGASGLDSTTVLNMLSPRCLISSFSHSPWSIISISCLTPHSSHMSVSFFRVFLVMANVSSASSPAVPKSVFRKISISSPDLSIFLMT